jgi:hypothetical protein
VSTKSGEVQKDLLVNGETKDPILLPVEVGLVKKDGEKHLVAFVGGTTVFQYTYPTTADTLQVQAAVD